MQVAILALFLLGATGRAGAEMLSGTTLVDHMRHGGYVLLMRHASSPTILPDKQSVDPDNIALERQLDEKGRNSAIAMGQAIKKLGIPVGAVLSSPTYRALETVRLAAFGTAKTFPQLGDGGHSMQASAVANQADWLREQVSDQPTPGSNTIIVTHMPNIVASFDGMAGDLTDGEALVFQPKGNGKSDLVAKVKIDDWQIFAHEQ
jgi:phosphohistidine phosphatase SixA